MMPIVCLTSRMWISLVHLPPEPLLLVQEDLRRLALLVMVPGRVATVVVQPLLSPLNLGILQSHPLVRRDPNDGVILKGQA